MLQSRDGSGLALLGPVHRTALTANRKRAVRRLLVALTLALSLASAACQPAPTYGDAGPSPAPATTRARTSAEAAAADAHWRATVEFAAAVEDAKWRAIVEFAAAVEAHRLAELAYPSGQCGGSLPPCWVMMRESRGDIRAENPTSTASGKWQFLDSTWRRTRAGRASGVGHAAYATERQQDDAARELWAGGRGCSHWSACGRR